MKCEVCYTDIYQVEGDASTLVDIYTQYHVEHDMNGQVPFYSIVIVPSHSLWDATPRMIIGAL